LKKDKKRIGLAVLIAVFFLALPLYLNYQKQLEEQSHVPPPRRDTSGEIPSESPSRDEFEHFLPKDDNAAPAVIIEGPVESVKENEAPAPSTAAPSRGLASESPANDSAKTPPNPANVSPELRQQAERYLMQQGASGVTPENIDRAYEKYLGRSPSAAEREQATELLKQYQ